MHNVINMISRINIEYKDGFFQVMELGKPVSKHATLVEAQWIKSVLESEELAA